MKIKIEEILDLLLTEMKKGKSIEDCLRAYPEYAQELEPLLRLSREIEDISKPEPNPKAVESVITKAREMISREKSVEKRFSFRKIFSLKPVMVRVIAVVLLVVLIGWTTVILSAKSMPGDFLYPMKLFTEKVQYTLTIDKEGKAELHLVFADRRTNELIRSFKKGEEINKELLRTMLIEALLALEYSETMSGERCKAFLEKIGRCNQCQKEFLEKIKPMTCSSDTAVINEAINTCCERCDCIKQKLNPESGTE
jgi:hypothetical protein